MQHGAGDGAAAGGQAEHPPPHATTQLFDAACYEIVAVSPSCHAVLCSIGSRRSRGSTSESWRLSGRLRPVPGTNWPSATNGLASRRARAINLWTSAAITASALPPAYSFQTCAGCPSVLWKGKISVPFSLGRHTTSHFSPLRRDHFIANASGFMGPLVQVSNRLHVSHQRSGPCAHSPAESVFSPWFPSRRTQPRALEGRTLEI